MPSADGWAEPPTVGERYRKERRRRGLIRVIIVAVGPIDEPTSDGDGKEKKTSFPPCLDMMIVGPSFHILSKNMLSGK